MPCVARRPVLSAGADGLGAGHGVARASGLHGLQLCRRRGDVVSAARLERARVSHQQALCADRSRPGLLELHLCERDAQRGRGCHAQGPDPRHEGAAQTPSRPHPRRGRHVARPHLAARQLVEILLQNAAHVGAAGRA